MGKYDRQAATAERLIKKYGTRAMVTRAAVVREDPVTQISAPGDPILKGCVTVGLPYGRSSAASRSSTFDTGSLIGKEVTDFITRFDDASFQPKPGDKINWRNVDWDIIWTSTLDPAADGPIYSNFLGSR